MQDGAKQRMKERYDRGVNDSVHFSFGQMLFVRDTNMIYDKNIPRWKGPFFVTDYGGEHQSSYLLPKLDGSKAPNTYHGDPRFNFF